MLKGLKHVADVSSALAASTLVLGRGLFVTYEATQPTKPLILYDFEACPFCRLVREAFCALNLDVEIRPCPRGGTRFRPEAQRLGGKLQFPLLVDQNTGRTLFESRDIINYLFRTYGDGRVPAQYRTHGLEAVESALASAARLGRGQFARPSSSSSSPPALGLHLWSFEASPYARLVRERLCELELPYTVHNLGKEHWKELGPAKRRIAPNPYIPREGSKRYAFWQAHGRVQVPYLQDPNTGAALFESRDILAYLDRTYAV
jgi:glutathione S-transferase